MSLQKITAADFEGIGNGQGIRLSLSDSTMSSNKKQGLIESMLLKGAENAISTQTLVEATGHSVRTLRKAIELERRNGALILSKAGGGYFLPADGEAGKREIEASYNVLRAKALSLLHTLRDMRKALQVIDGQEKLDAWTDRPAERDTEG